MGAPDRGGAGLVDRGQLSRDGRGAVLSDVIEVKNALRALINRPGSEADAIAYIEEVVTGFGGVGVGAGGNKNDRGAAILLAANLESSLQIAIERKEPTADRTATFEAKIKKGHALGLFGKETKNNLDLIGGYETHSHTRLAPSVFRRPRLKARALFLNYRLRSEKQMIMATQLGDSALGWHASA